MKLGALIAALLAAAAAPAAEASYKPHHRHARPARTDPHSHSRGLSADSAQRPTSFSGNCTFSGLVRFQPALTNSAQPVADFATASGTCSGTFTNGSGHSRQLNGAPVGYEASDQGASASCALNPGAAGSGELIFPSGKLAFNLSESRVASLAWLSLTGRTGGSATGEANTNPNANLVQAVEACSGSGLAQSPVDIRLQTTSSISG